MRTMMVKV